MWIHEWNGKTKFNLKLLGGFFILQEQLLRDRGKKLMKPGDLAGSRRGSSQENGII